MEVKHQVFVSSTYKDLVEERQEVMQALLELDCIPVGMELFPAADDDQWTLIKGLIDDCDYYILIVGGRYGSVNPEGVSYTQMEYQYAIEQGIPVISFLHKNPENIPVGKSEIEKALKKKLEDFKKIVQQKMCKYYESPIELGSIVSRSLVRLIKDKPQPGWVKATYLPSEDSTKEILELTKQVENLKLELEKSKTKAPEGTELLSQGDDKIEVNFTFKARGDWRIGDKSYSVSTELSWNEIFGEISPLMIDETSERPIRVKLNELVRNKTFKELSKKVKKDERVPTEFSIEDTDYQTIKIQLRALNLMTESIRKRGVRDTATYWTLTPYGDTVMTRLRAIKRKPK
ncbi:MAG: DUF4062 domain-containing protein [Flavobacteriales bacterium]|nr:DUF4062 domain-containing protein [Flavobacteriales bacterium]MCW8912293.1 DUF4062 domain-containing protein [Flavobacteriales bacterium]MCW8937468.1 DUF4062 domain-containing protein [Flavobacteriales bacterium]MCW8940653.1 DUF4062 domain-containing protein [Flavobacteriales bacterium]MCW8968357.1 DUF4062 domain-containing protein [Flavobacteriales bacterium]